MATWSRMNIDVILENDTPYSGHVLKCYLPGTTTATSVATDKDGNNTYATLTTNANGVFEVGGAEVLPYIDRDHKWALFANATDATNNTNPVLGFFDNVPYGSASSQDYDGNATIKQKLDNLDVTDYAALRTALGTGQVLAGNSIRVTNDGIEGVFFVYARTSETDNGGTVITDGGALFAKRDYKNVVKSNWFECTTDGTDNATRVTAMHDALPNGGTIEFIDYAAGTEISISVVDITNKGITVNIGAGVTLKKHGSGGASARGMFRIQNLLDASFKICGYGEIDLNGEGPMGLGVAGRISNIYGTLNPIGGRTVYGANGPLNAAIFALRSSKITVTGLNIKNTGESGLLFRNCAEIEVCQQASFENCSNFGVEFSLVDPASDGGTGALPDNIGDYHVHHCNFKDIDDFGLGGGNGTGIGGGGSSTAVHKNINIHHNYADGVTRTWHFEFNSGGRIEEFSIDHNHDLNARQGSIGLVGARNGTVSHNVILNPSSGPYNGLFAFQQTSPVEADYVSSHGITLSTDVDRVKVAYNVAIDNRDEISVTGTDGAITAGTKIFTSASAVFVPSDVNKWIGIDGAVSSDPVALVSRIAVFLSSTSVELDVNAGATVSGAKYIYGSALRRGFDMNGGVACDVIGNTFDCGKVSGLTNEPVSAAVYLQNPTGKVTVKNNRGAAPGGSGTAQAGFRVSNTISGTVDYKGNSFTGYAENYENVDALRASLNPGVSSLRLGSTATPNASIGVDGTEIFSFPAGDYWVNIAACSVSFNNISAETLTATVTFYRFDGVSNSQALASSSDTETAFTVSALADLITDRAPIRAIGLKVQSTKASSTADVKINYIGISEN